MKFKRMSSRQFLLLFLFGASLFLLVYMVIFHCEQYTDSIKKNINFETQSLLATEKPKLQSAKLVILILTGPKNQDRRNTIRETWMSNLPEEILTYFVIGTHGLEESTMAALEFEQTLWKDLCILPNFKDSYFALTDKVIKSFKWVHDNVNYNYIFKGDDDTFVQVDKLFGELKSLPSEKLYWGFFDGRANVKKSGQWAEPNWILCDKYTPHALGGGYILSADLVSFIVQNEKLLQKFNSEDVSVGAWLGALDINRVHDPRFDTEYKSRGCHNSYIVTHKQDIKMMRDKHKHLEITGTLCPDGEIKARNSFIYNWKAFPSQCCTRNDSSVP